MSRAATKSLLMNQQVVVGVGNIYASEALYAAGIRPQRRAYTLRKADLTKLVEEVRRILRAAIAGGGSTIRDYRRSDSSAGQFQNSHRVYNRAGLPCYKCATLIRRRVIVGRSSFFCPICQT
jgi:formamidopyrimidine-DNA glycosylase